AGFKFAYLQDDWNTGTFQLRVYTPTGQADKGLGTHHVSLEPAMLYFHKFSDRLVSESELRLWIPIGGTEDVTSNVFRYGTGLSYALWEQCQYKVMPVVELVGWTFMGGQKLPPTPDDSTVETMRANGDTIVNIKIGTRVKFGDLGDFYAGYGRAIT